MVSCRIEREKFYPGPGLEPWLLTLLLVFSPLSYPGQVRERLILSWIHTCPGSLERDISLGSRRVAISW